jgi:hypothetical protein
MRKFVPVLFLFFLHNSLSAQVAKNPSIVNGHRTAVTGSLKNWKPDNSNPLLRIKMRDEKGLIFARDLDPLTFTNYGSRFGGPDPLWQKNFDKKSNISVTSGQEQALKLMESKSLEWDASVINKNFDGIPIANVSPGDPTIAVGPNHILEMVNGQNGSAYFRIFDKNGGALGLQAFMDQLPGSSYNGGGDCIAWYDQLENRFVMTEFGDSSQTGTNVNTLIIAVSQTSDPLGSWYIYEFSDNSFFPDYPKYANWHDAWYGMTRDFEGSYIGNSVWAFNKAKMIAGDSVAEVQRFRFSSPDNKYNSMCPVSLLGNLPAPAGTPGMFLYYSDDNFTVSQSDVDSVGIITFKVDFANPANSVARIESSMAVAPFRSNVCGSRNCAPSPSGNGYDVISSRFMNRPYYRNFGPYQSIVGNHTVDATGSSVSGLRWYEFRSSLSPWSVYQQGTFSPQDDFACNNTPNMHRFMGAIAMNSKGQIAMGYNSSSAERFASISVTGRNSTDPLNLMSYQEKDAILGTGYGSFGNRWGDYNEIIPDAVNDSLFWFCGMYGSGPNSWKTRIVSFTLAPNNELDAAISNIEFPNTCENLCSQLVNPRVKIKNNGNQILTSATINIQLENGTVSSYPWTGTLQITQENIFVLPLVTLPTGTFTLKAFITNPNGGADQNSSNDTSSISVSVSTPAVLPFSEGFESVTFLPGGWSQFTNGGNSFRWSRTTSASFGGAASVKFDNYNNNEPGKFSDLRTPLLNATASDSINLSFRMAAALFDLQTSDTLEIWVSTDCGGAFQRVWRKFGTDLATRPGALSAEYIPTPNEWRQENVNLSAYAGSEKIIISFRNINNFGNNIYLDDISITKAAFPVRDASILRINSPIPVVCETSIVPDLSFVNLGKDTLKTLKISYSIDGGPVQSSNWSGSLTRLQGSTIKLAGSTVTTGQRTLTVYSAEPNGLTDEFKTNDTARLAFGVKKQVSLPVTEGFEGNSFPPDQWNQVNPDNRNSWINSPTAARNGASSLLMKNFNYAPAGQVDEFISPLVNYSNVDSVYLHFQLSAATMSFPGSTEIPLDTLEILVSTDCGKSYTTVYQKWGAALQTLGNVNTGNTAEFIPRTQKEWRKEELNLTSILGTSNSFLVNFRNTSNTENNIFIDDINIFTKTLPAKLKNNGYLISPNPFRNKFTLQHYPGTEKFNGLDIYNSLGQRVYSKIITPGTGSSVIDIDLGTLPSGIYMVRIIYTDRIVVERVVKQN